MKKLAKTVFITGSSGFIGSNLAKRILTTEPDTKVIGLDNMNDYYDVRIKEARLAELQKFENYTFIKGNLADKALINSIFEKHHPDIVVNLGAQAGVRYSITNPDAYIESNMIGFYNILEACRHYPVEHLVYASSSSVYGSNKKVPYSTDDKVDNPVSLYAATKKSNELMAHAYSKLYNIPSTGLRFFTVYGPAGRPDMAYFGFTNKLVNGETIKIFNYGNCKRDFTYASLISTVFIIWVILLVLPLFSELEFLGVKVKKEVKKAVEKSNEEVKASINNLQQLVSQIQVSNSVAPQFTINGGSLPSEERIDNLIKEIHLLNAQNTDRQADQQDKADVPASNLELFKMRYGIEIRIREALELIGYSGKTRTSLMQATYYLNQQGVLDSTSTDLIIQMLRIANRGVHGEIISQKYMDFASQAYPQIIDGLDNCKDLIKEMT